MVDMIQCGVNTGCQPIIGMLANQDLKPIFLFPSSALDKKFSCDDQLTWKAMTWVDDMIFLLLILLSITFVSEMVTERSMTTTVMFSFPTLQPIEQVLFIGHRLHDYRDHNPTRRKDSIRTEPTKRWSSRSIGYVKALGFRPLESVSTRYGVPHFALKVTEALTHCPGSRATSGSANVASPIRIPPALRRGRLPPRPTSAGKGGYERRPRPIDDGARRRRHRRRRRRRGRCVGARRRGRLARAGGGDGGGSGARAGRRARQHTPQADAGAAERASEPQRRDCGAHEDEGREEEDEERGRSPGRMTSPAQRRGRPRPAQAVVAVVVLAVADVFIRKPFPEHRLFSVTLPFIFLLSSFNQTSIGSLTRGWQMVKTCLFPLADASTPPPITLARRAVRFASVAFRRPHLRLYPSSSCFLRIVAPAVSAVAASSRLLPP
ncbi:Protein of unknown function, partial [Gryllus bimaculatus]